MYLLEIHPRVRWLARNFIYFLFRNTQFLYWRKTHKDNEIICPFCNSHFRRFIPAGINNPVLRNVIGAGRRKNVICPKCNSKDRERHIFLYLKRKKLFDIPLGSKILHVAPEDNLCKILASRISSNYISCDLSVKYINSITNTDITHINFLDNCFDIIICNHVLEHIIDDIKAMKELFRVLKPNGHAILQVPYDPTLSRTYEDSSIISPSHRLKIFGQKDHVRIYGNDYIERLSKAGFKVNLDRTITQNDKSVRKYALIKHEPIFLGIKE